MTSICFYFQVHQPYRLRRVFERSPAEPPVWFDDEANEVILRKVADRCYLPMNALLARVIAQSEGRFRCAFSLSGTVLRQLEAWSPEALDSFRALVDTGSVELLGETSMHSLAALEGGDEFEQQVREHRARLRRLFGVEPTSFRDTELIFDETVARRVERLGFDCLLGEGADRLLRGRSPTDVYRVSGCERMKLLLRSYSYSDDIAFRFSNREWEAYPLFAPTFAEWLERTPADARFLGLFMDYETFGEHQWKSTGIFDFMEALPALILERGRFDFATPREVAAAHEPVGDLSVPTPVSWADEERDLHAWLGNPMQSESHARLYRLLADVRRAADQGRPDLLEAWRLLTTSDHVYYMATKKVGSDGDVHEYFSPYDSPYDAYLVFARVLDDLELRVKSLSRPRSAAGAREGRGRRRGASGRPE